MAGDYTRFRYSPLNDTNSILWQQGRVLLDQDWNEYAQLQDRRWRSETMDIMGRAVVPIDTPHAFEILIGGTSFTIGVGRMYVDGLQPENHGVDPSDPTNRNYDVTLGEFVGKSPIPYKSQPYLPNPPALPTDGQPHLVYLDVWERELTYLEDPTLIDQAVAVDTGTRLQTVWQVKMLTDQGNFDCSTPPSSVPSLAPSAGRLTTAAAGVPSSTDPCIVPANGGYRGSGNRCYRVEIHDGGPMGTATFKWSRDNASVATPVTGINAALDTLTVVLTKRDSVLRFQSGDWVEVTDDFRYFAGLPGEMRQVAIVDDVNLTIRLQTPLPAGQFDTAHPRDPKRNTRVVRWDQKGIVFDPLGNQIVDVDTNGGLIPVPAAGTTIVLEDGIQVTLSIDVSLPVPNFRPLDYWMFDARVVDASIEILKQAAPRGILHHYAWLATVTLPGGPTPNCRVFWPPSMGESCDCTVCVTADSHNNGTLTLQSAVNQVMATGGKICLGPGIYLITSPVAITSAQNIEISGHGLPSLVASGLSSQQPIFQIETSIDISMEDIAFVGPQAVENPPVIGVDISDSLFTRINRCAFIGFLGEPTHKSETPSTMSRGVALSGVIWDAQIQDCLFTNVQVGIGAPTAEGGQPFFVASSSFRNNEMALCTSAGFKFDNPKLVANFFDVSFVDNFVVAPSGFLFAGNGLDIAVERNSLFLIRELFSRQPGVHPGIQCAGSQVRIAYNQIFGAGLGNQRADGIVLAKFMYGTQVTGNRLDTLTGDGIQAKKNTILVETIISQNQLLSLGGAGIIMEQVSYAIDLNITSNAMNFVGLNSEVDLAFKQPVMGGILLLAALINVNVNDNTIEAVGLDANASASRAGILLLVVSDFRSAGNRLVDVGPPSTVNLSAGIVVLEALGRVDIIDNEVRRAALPPPNGDTSQWSAVAIVFAFGNIFIRGNLLESFGAAPTALVGFALSCVFTENQCFLDNVATVASPNPTSLVVLVGFNQSANAGAIMASNNFVQTPGLLTTGLPSPPPVMILNPKDQDKTLTVLGNITRGPIEVFSGALPAVWAPLNVQNV